MARRKQEPDSGWSLGAFSDAMRRQSEENERNKQDYFARFKAEMPAQVRALRGKENQELLDLFLEFSGYRSDPREYELRQKFNGHIQKEILRRMSMDRSEELRGRPIGLPIVGRR